MLAYLLLIWFIVVIFPEDGSTQINLSPNYRPIPPTDLRLQQDKLSNKLEFKICSPESGCDKVLEDELEIDDGSSNITMVIEDMDALFGNRKFAEKIAIGCAKMTYLTILVLWDEFQSNYFQAVANTHGVGKQIAMHIVKGLTNIHLIGLGLGAHIAGFIGKHSNEKGRKIMRITALDPARILYEYNGGPKEFRLSREDAEFVDVYHTDYKEKMRVGFIHSIGTVDFYENGGSKCSELSQPDADSLFVWNRASSELKFMISPCKHNLAALNFIATMYQNCTLYAMRNPKDDCMKDNCIALGLMTEVFTNDESAGGGDGNYVYNCSKCYIGVPENTDSNFAKIYDNFQRKAVPLIKEKSWLVWVLDETITGISLAVEVITGLLKKHD